MSTPSYWVAIAEPGNVIASATSTSISFTGLTSNTSYLVTVFGIYGNNVCTGPSTLTITTTTDSANITNIGSTMTLNSTPSTNSNNTLYALRMSSDGKYGIMAYTTTTLYISSNYCNTWTSVTRPTASNSYAVGMSPTGQYCILPTYGGGVWRSTNYGATWTQSNASTGINWTTAVSNQTGNRWIMTSGNTLNGLYYSSDYGATWTQSNITSQRWDPIAITPSGNVAVACTGGNGTALVSGFLYSTNYGQSWITSSTNISDQTTYNSGKPGLSQVCISDNGVYCVAPGYNFNAASVSGVWYSTNSGVTWNVSTMTSAPSKYEWFSVVSDSSGKNVVISTVNVGFAGANNNKGFWVSTNYGVTFSKNSYFTTSNFGAIAASSDLRYFSAMIYNGRIYYGTNPY
jgi:hypothetical protein